MTTATNWALSRNQVPARTNDFDAAAEARVYKALRSFWHPVLRSEDLGFAPQAVELCGERLVAVRLDGEVCVFNDLCAHRGTALSLGAVVDGSAGEELRCPYHGWQYSAEGRCTLTPQRPELAGRMRARVRKYPVTERYGLVWVCLRDDPALPVPVFPEYDDPDYHHVHFPVVDWNCTAPRRVENYIDVAHFAFVHDGWLGDINHPEVAPHKVWREDRALRMVEENPVRHPATYSRWEGVQSSDGMVEVWNSRSIFMPLTVRLEIRGADREYVQFFHPTPLSARRIRNFTIVARNFGDPEAAFRDHAEFNMTVYEQDRPIVESQRPEDLPEDLSLELHVKGVDTYAVEYRRWLLEIANELVSE